MADWVDVAVGISNVGVGIALAVFAYMQWAVTKKGNDRENAAYEHAKELRRQDALLDQDRNYQVAQAQAWRIQQIAAHWSKADLVELALTDALQPEYVEIPESSRFIECLTSLDDRAGYAGASAVVRSK